MKALREFLDKQEKWFVKGGKLEKLFPLYESIDTLFYTPSASTSGATHIRDGLDFKRMMITVVISLIPCTLMGIYNIGYQANYALAQLGMSIPEGWRGELISFLGIGFSTHDIFANFIHGALYFLPIYAVTMITGISWELLFCSVRKHEVNEGFFVTGLLFPLTLPPTIPLWQVAVGITFGVVVAKEVFGGTGMNIFNPALAARGFLFFAYPAQISGDAVWVACDGYTCATPLAVLAEKGVSALSAPWLDSFIGLTPGTIGGTSVLACLLGAGILIITGVASWRIMVSSLAGLIATALMFNIIGSTSNPMFSVSPEWHIVMGGFIFGTVFMATDPVTACVTEKGKVIYGLLIGSMVVLIRVVNPAFPEGILLAILFANIFAPIIDHYVVKSNIKRRRIRNAS